MAYRHSRRTFMQSVLALAGSGPILARTATPMNVALYYNYLPLSTYDDQTGWQGFGVDLLDRIFDSMINEVGWQPMPELTWLRALKSLEHGDLSLLFEVSYRQERTAYMDYIGTTDVEHAYLLVRDYVNLDDIPDLQIFMNLNLTIALNPSVSWNADFDDRRKTDPNFRRLFVDWDTVTLPEHEDSDSMSTLSSGTYAATVRLISRGRLGGCIVDAPNAQRAVEMSKKLTSDTGVGVPLKAVRISAFGEPVTYLVASRKLDPAIRERLHAAYDETRLDGSFDKIWAKWRGSEAVPSNISHG